MDSLKLSFSYNLVKQLKLGCLYSKIQPTYSPAIIYQCLWSDNTRRDLT